MPCFSPIKGYWSREKNKNGKNYLVFNPKEGYPDKPLDVPCGSCEGCRLERSRQWAVRCVHEASLHEDNCFITLTYDDEHLPENGSLNKKDFQDFMKRLRKSIHPKKVRFFHCGEYGSRLARPHFHALLFGYDFPDKRYLANNKNALAISETLSKLWDKGFHTIGELTFESAAYVARYITKKVFGDEAEEHYIHVDESTGEISRKQPEYITMSRRPGIAAEWIEKYLTDTYKDDKIIMRGVEMKPPRYYDKKYEAIDEGAMAIIKGKRADLPEKVVKNNYPERLDVRKKVLILRNQNFKRSYEND